MGFNYYTGEFTIETSGLLGAKATKEGYVDSDVVNQQYDIVWWQPLGNGTDDKVYSLAVDERNRIFAGGEFHNAGGSGCNHIAKWEAAAWNSIGSIDGPVNALSVDDSYDELYVGGEFITAEGVTSNNIAKWNGASWSSLESGTNGAVNAIYANGGGALIGGVFTEAGNVSNPRIAKWVRNPATWEAFGNADSAVNAIAVKNSNVYAGGGFESMNTVPCINVASREYGQLPWYSLGSSWGSSSVFALAIDTLNVLYAGGMFPPSYLLKFDGSSWSALGDGITGRVDALKADDSGNVYVGGIFSVAGGLTCNNIARWTGSTWEAIGDGTSGRVYAIAFDTGGNLIVGGAFTTAGGITCNNIAKWGKKE